MRGKTILMQGRIFEDSRRLCSAVLVNKAAIQILVKQQANEPVEP
jgi:hypothetical protein